jgi:eukaryotic-like serine/threonine-protein kinase
MADVRAPGWPTQGGGITSSSLGRGTRLGRYELLAPIGVGGMAKVWAARQTGYGGFAKIVAIKTILPHLSRESDFERLFVDEARVASLVHHANVCEIFELSEEAGVLFLVMEWVDGDSMVKLLKPAGQVLSIHPRLAARIGADTCAGLHAAHQQLDHDGKPLNIVHRDVSPHNILLSAEGVVKVTDFGVAKAAGQTHDQTVAGQLKGKLEYMSPEQITGTRVDGRTDVFGIGAVIYEAATGHQPFESNGDLEVMTKIVEGRLAPPSTHMPDFPRDLEAIIVRAMAKDPEARFPTADAMRVALEDWMTRSGPPVTHAEVAAVLRERVGTKMDERLDRIRIAMGPGVDRNPSHTPSASGVIATGKVQPRVAPAPPAVPQALVPRPPPSRPAAPSPRPQQAEERQRPDSDAPDSGGDFAMDTVIDFRVPDDLAGPPGAPPSSGGRPIVQAPPAPLPAAGVPLPSPFQMAAPESAGAPQYDSELPLEEEAPLEFRQYVVAAAIGILVAVALGGAAFITWKLFLSPDSHSLGPARALSHRTA